MPTIEDLGKLMKQKYQGTFDDVPDAELGRKVKAKYSGSFDEFSDSTKDIAAQHLSSLKQQAGVAPGATAAQTAGAFQQQGQAQQQAIVGKAWGQAASGVLKGGGVAAATLLTGGVGLPAALAIMGGAGALSSLAGTGVEEATGTHKSLAERAKETALDTGGAMIGEGIGRGIGLVAKKLIPQALAASAARSQRGFDLLHEQETQSLMDLYGKIRDATPPGTPGGTFNVDVSAPIKQLAKDLGKLPTGRGPFFGRFAKLSDAAEEGYQQAMGHLQLAKQGGQIGDLQPLDAAVAAKRTLQQFAYGSGSGAALERTEAGIFKRAARGLDAEIMDNFRRTGSPDWAAQYQQINRTAQASLRATQAAKFGEALVTRLVTGGAGGVMGGLLGGRHGAEVGALAGAFAPQLSTLALEQVAEHPQAAATMRQAVNAFNNGFTPTAFAYGMRALKLSGANQTLGQAMDYFNDQAQAAPGSLPPLPPSQ